MKKAILLFAHGARDPEWAKPFEHLRDEVAGRIPGTTVQVAFLEFMQPALPDALDALIRDGVCEIDIVPAFMAQGGHLKNDLPKILDAMRDQHRDTQIRLLPAIGDVEAILDAIAEWLVGAMAG